MPPPLAAFAAKVGSFLKPGVQTNPSSSQFFYQAFCHNNEKEANGGITGNATFLFVVLGTPRRLMGCDSEGNWGSWARCMG